jgi:HK97 family phage prohead protease
MVKDVDEKGMVSFYASIFNTPDRVKDVVDPSAYKKTIEENIKEIQHYKNHVVGPIPGIIHSLTTDDTGLLTRSKLILGTQLGRETYEEYKAFAEAGKSMAHSIGYYPVKEEKQADGYNHLKEIFLYEVSSLTVRAAHPDALTIDIKSFDELDINELIKEESFYKSLLNCRFDDTKLESLELLKNHISALIEELSRKDALEISKPLTVNDYLKMLN